MKKTLLLSLISLSTLSQGFLPGADTFSHKKPAYVTLKTGKEVEGTIKDIDRKKGNIEEVSLDAGKKVKFSPEQISNMYLPQSGLDRLGKAMDAVYTVDKWDNMDLNLETIDKGYAYFEQTRVLIKKKEYELLMQLVNPHFSNKLKVYFDPYARETMSVGVAGLTVAGGIDKSYFVKKGDVIAFKVEKKNYETVYPELFKECPSLVEKIKADPDWKDFAIHVAEYSKCD